MHTIEKCLTLDSNILKLEALENKYIALSTQDGQARINSCKNYENKLIIESEKLTSDVVTMSFSPNVELLAFAVKSNIYVLDTRIGEILNTIEISAKEINLLTFDSTSQYLIVGTKYGRVFQYKYDNPSVLSRLCSFPYDRTITQEKNFTNFVSAVTFYGSKVACSGYGGAIFVTDLHVNTHKEVITFSDIRTNTLCFVNMETLISGKDNGDIDVIYLKSTIEHKHIETNFKTIKHIIPILNTNYIFVSSEQNSLAIVDLKEHRVINEAYAIFDDIIINMVLLDSDTIIIALNNSDIFKLNLPTVATVEKLIKDEALYEVLRRTQTATIAKNYKCYQKIENQYNNIYKMATKALINNNKKLAINLLKKYSLLESKQKDINILFETFKYYEKFKLCVDSKNYRKAYEISYRFPILEHTDEYKNMNNIWKNSFLNAQKELLAGNLNNAKKILNIYRNIPAKKEMCSFIFTYPNDFVLFLKALIKKDFETTDRITRKFSSFKHIPTYVNLTKKIEGSLKLIENCIMKSNTTLARKHLEKLKRIPHIKHKVRELNLDCYNIEQLQIAYKKDDIKSCYQLLDTKKILHHIKLGKSLEEKWGITITNCEKYALLGDVENVKQTLKELINIESRKSKLGDLLRVAYHTKIKQFINEEKSENAKETIFSYLHIFGIDHEIEEIVSIYELNFSIDIILDDKKYKRGFRDNWRISIEDI
ncbi:MAG: hypothetical protein U9N02_05910 [Campylobacterota bacterium]|nr:hypothetical protein [Campylobacterota bacterium]